MKERRKMKLLQVRDTQANVQHRFKRADRLGFLYQTYSIVAIITALSCSTALAGYTW